MSNQQIDLITWNKCGIIYDIMDKDFGLKESLKERQMVLHNLLFHYNVSMADMHFYINRRERLLR